MFWPVVYTSLSTGKSQLLNRCFIGSAHSSTVDFKSKSWVVWGPWCCCGGVLGTLPRLLASSQGICTGLLVHMSCDQGCQREKEGCAEAAEDAKSSSRCNGEKCQSFCLHAQTGQKRKQQLCQLRVSRTLEIL